MSREVPEYYKRRLADMGGRLPDGTPRLRLVFGPDAKRAHGQLKGIGKYLDPETGKPFAWWFVEQWVPATMCGTRETWNYEFLGTYPGDCDRDCCNRGYWSVRFPVCGGNGEYIPLTDATLDSIERKQYADIQFSMLDEISRLEQLDKLMAKRDKNVAEVVDSQATEIGEHYFSHKEKEDNADNRVYSMPGGLSSAIPGAKYPVGRPNINI